MYGTLLQNLEGMAQSVTCCQSIAIHTNFCIVEMKYVTIERDKCMTRLRIAEIAKEKGLNQSQLQIKSGVTPPLLNRYWNNHIQSVNLDALTKIARALGVVPGDLIIEDERREEVTGH